MDRGNCCNRNEEVYSKWFGLYHLGKDQGDNIVMLQVREDGHILDRVRVPGLATKCGLLALCKKELKSEP